MNSIDILYYDNMIDLVNENHKINKAIMDSKFTHYFTESQEELSLCEAKVTESIANFFKAIFDKVIEFFKKLINVVSDIKNFTPNKKLISQSEDKLKSMSQDEKKEFSIKVKLNLLNDDQYLDYLLERSEKAISDLEEIVYNIKDLAYKDTLPENLEKELEDFDTELKEPTKTEVTIKYIGLKEIISQYENMYSRVKTLRSQLQADQNSMNNYKKTIENMIRKNTNNDYNNILNKYREITLKICNIIMRVNKEIINEMMYSFKLYEEVLKFYTKNKEDYEKTGLTDAFYDAVKTNKKLRVRIMMKDSLLVDPSFKQFATMESVANSSIKDLYDKHDGDKFITDKSKWDDDYMNKLMVQIVNNFSHERINHLKDVVRYLRPIN